MSKAKAKVEGVYVFFLLCYFKQEKHAHFAAYDSDYRASAVAPSAASESCKTNHRETTNKCPIKYLNLMCI